MLVIQARNGMGWGYCPKGSGLEQCCRYTDEPGFDTRDEAVAAIKRDKHIPANVRIEFDPDPDATLRPSAPRLDPATNWPFPRGSA
jgi:hypothetical protein